jgi:flagellar biosynthesis/type III secretory pathway protein FliH
VEDATLAPGSVLIDSSRGVLDASVDTQLAEIERGFADVVRSGS